MFFKCSGRCELKNLTFNYIYHNLISDTMGKMTNKQKQFRIFVNQHVNFHKIGVELTLEYFFEKSKHILKELLVCECTRHSDVFNSTL